MRSIRRSMTIYLIAWSLITVGLVWVVMDRVTAEVLVAREADGVTLFEAQYKQRCHEEIQNTDDALLNQAKRLYGLITEHSRIRWFKLTDQAFTALRNVNVPPELLAKLDPLKDKELSRGDLVQEIAKVLNPDETKQYQDIILNHAGSRLRVDRVLLDMAPLMFTANPLAEAAWVATGNAPSATIQYEVAPFMFLPNPFTQAAWTSLLPTPSPTIDMLSRMYFANLPFPKEYMQRISETSTGTEYHQVNAITGAGRGGEWHSESLVEHKLPFDPKEIDTKLPDHGKPFGADVWFYDDTTIAHENENDNENVHRIIFRGTRQVFAPSPRPGPGGPPPRPVPGGVGTSSNPPQRPTGPTPSRSERDRPTPQPLDNRLYIQCARPQAEIDARLATFANERDDARAKLAEDIQSARKNTMLQLTVVGLIAILAIAIGGPLIVSAGLRPVGKLSDAVSRVS